MKIIPPFRYLTAINVIVLVENILHREEAMPDKRLTSVRADA
jgi:hypothetical protein